MQIIYEGQVILNIFQQVKLIITKLEVSGGWYLILSLD